MPRPKLKAACFKLLYLPNHELLHDMRAPAVMKYRLQNQKSHVRENNMYLPHLGLLPMQWSPFRPFCPFPYILYILHLSLDRVWVYDSTYVHVKVVIMARGEDCLQATAEEIAAAGGEVSKFIGDVMKASFLRRLFEYLFALHRCDDLGFLNPCYYIIFEHAVIVSHRTCFFIVLP